MISRKKRAFPAFGLATLPHGCPEEVSLKISKAKRSGRSCLRAYQEAISEKKLKVVSQPEIEGF